MDNLGPELQMTRLASSFPCMSSKFEDGSGNGLQPWDASRIAFASRGWSGGERLVVSFLLTVWDSEQGYYPAFNPVEAYKKWDFEHWAAFIGWAVNAFYC